jgi:hypothetical protein
MAKQLMIYDTAVPVAHGRHGGWSIDVAGDFGFSRGINSVPLTAVEFTAAASEYVIIFAGTGDVVMPAVLLGMRDEENLYLTETGGWKARYVPAFLRRYPFVFASRDEGKTFTLCIDEGYAGFNTSGRGQALYEERQKPSQYTQNVLKFLQQYQLEFQRTQAFCRKLKELNLLEPMRAQVSLESGERIALGGFMAVDRNRLKTLSSERLAELVKSDEMEWIHAHLLSMRNFAGMRERLAAAPVTTTSAGTKADAHEATAAPETQIH